MAKASKETLSARQQKRLVRLKAIDQCKDALGRIIPRRLWKAAQADKNHPYHNEFEWDQRLSAEENWDKRAAELIREIRLEVIIDDQKIMAPYYVSDPRSDGPGYISTVRIAKREDWAQSVLLDELKRLEGGINRARDLATVFKLESEFERLLENLFEVRRRVMQHAEAEETRAHV